MKMIIVGAGGITRDLLRRLGDRWEVTVVDVDPDRLDLADKVRPIERILGDGSSRVVLDRAGLSEVDAFVAASNDDEVNLEACRLALEAEVYRIAAIAADPERLPDYRALGVAAISPDRLGARRLEINLEDRRVSSAAFADGRAEAAEFRIEADSPLVGRALQDLHLESWLVAVVLRNGELIVPHGGTVLREGDLVTVVGAATDYPEMVATFTGGVARFPLDYGKHVGVAIGSLRDVDVLVSEAAGFVHATAAESVIVLHAGGTGDDRSREIEDRIATLDEQWPGVEIQARPVDRTGLDALVELCRTDSVGTLVVPRVHGRLGAAKVLRMAQETRTPVLFAQGIDRYQGILVPARETDAGRRAGRVGIDIAAHSGLPLIGVGVVPPVFIAGEEAFDDARHAIARLREDAAVHGLSIKRRIRQGNPVQVITELAPGHLVVLGIGPRRPTALAPGITGHVVVRAETSVLAVPVRGSV